MSGLSGFSRSTFEHNNTIIGPSITYTPYHPMSYSRGGRIGHLTISANLFPVDKQYNNFLQNALRVEKFNEAFRRQTINPFN